MLKLLGVVVVIIAFSLLGLTVAKGYGLRVRQLEDLQSAFALLETEVVYGLTPLPEAFARVSARVAQPAAGLLGQAAQGLSEAKPVQEAWNQAVACLGEMSALKREDLEILRYFGCGLGEADIREQQKKFRLLAEQLERAVAAAWADKNKNQRIWQYLGVSAGIAVALLLI